VGNIVIQVNGSAAGDGFLIAPDFGITFVVPLNLSTNDGSTVSATIDATPNGAGVTLPGGNSVPTELAKPVGRVVRFNNPVPLRTRASEEIRRRPGKLKYAHAHDNVHP
jgi:hypothetical protein